jgi:ATP adenylyltransferase
VPLERLAAAWREGYVTDVAHHGGAVNGDCVFCRLADQEVSGESGVIARGEYCFVILNAFPYGSGHLLVLPLRHEGELSNLSESEFGELFVMIRRTAAAVERAYGADGMNIGFNLGSAAGAGIPQHLHAHVLPRWAGDTNFMSSIGETRVLPESLERTWQKIRAAWL